MEPIALLGSHCLCCQTSPHCHIRSLSRHSQWRMGCWKTNLWPAAARLLRHKNNCNFIGARYVKILLLQGLELLLPYIFNSLWSARVPALGQPIPVLHNFSHVVSLFVFAAAFGTLSNEEPVVQQSSPVHSDLETASGGNICIILLYNWRLLSSLASCFKDWMMW